MPKKQLSRKRVTGKLVDANTEKAAGMLAKWAGKAAVVTVRSVDTLGGELQLADQIRRGFPTAAVEEIVDSGLIEPEVIYEIVIPRRTLAHRKQKQQRLSPEESDRFARVVRVYSRAQDALGDITRASRWLQKENRALRGQRPIDLLGSDAGARAVEKVLGRVEHGIVS